MSKCLQTSPRVYPRRYFDAAPTWNAWNKLTIRDVHSLSILPGFEGQDVYFYRNHPIRYVSLVGVIVGIEPTPGEKYVVIALDDGSGACIHVKVTRRQQRDSGDSALKTSILATTDVVNLDIDFKLSIPNVFIKGHQVEVGAVVRVKGTVAVFRDERQLALKRIWLLPSTSAEVEHWEETAHWKATILSKPWILSAEDQERIDETLRKQSVSHRHQAKHAKARNRKREEKKRVHEAKQESRRQLLETEMNSGALVGSGDIPRPWD